jgi:PAS domain S-box-containing protein
VKDFFNHKIALNFLFCISYFLLATLGFEWGALTANATLLWPPSGLAVFGCIAFGRRALPGLLVGAIISSKIISLSDPLSNSVTNIVVAMFCGLACILQAMLIAKLSTTYYQREFRVSTSSSIFFTLIVLIGCFVSTTISNLTLWQAGIINLTAALQNWAVWWIGDAIGVLIVAPLLLWIYRKQSLYKNSQANAFLIFCAGVGIVLLTTAAVGHSEHETQRKNLVHETENLQLSIQTNIDLATRDLSTLQEYFLNNTPTQAQFRKITEPLLKRSLWLDSFSWMPISEESQRPQNSALNIDFAASLTLARVNNADFVWRQLDDASLPKALLTDIQMRLVPSQSDIFFRKNTGQGDSQKNPLMNMAAPIYACNSNKKFYCKIYGLVNSELNLNSLIRAAVTKTQLQNLDIKLAIQQPPNKITYWQWNKDFLLALSNQNAIGFKTPVKLNGKIPAIKIMDTEWQLLVSPQNISIWFLPSVQQCTVLLIGLTIVILLSAYLQALYRQDQLIIDNQTRLEKEIYTQTQALRSANDWLLKEMEEKHTTQEQLKASEAHMRTLLDNIPDPVWFKSPEGSYLSINKAVTTLFKRNEQDVIGKQAGDYVDQDFENLVRDYEKVVLASNGAIRRELWMHIPSRNQHRLMDTIKVAVRDSEQKPLGILSIARDITEQHKLINELEKFKRFAEYASEGFSIMTLTAETVYMNRSIQKMLLSNQEVEHNDFFNYFPVDLHQQWREHILPHVLLNGYWQGELAALRADGSRFPTKETFFVIRDDKAQPIYLGEVMIDISEQKQVEASLQLAKETAEDATHAKSRFLANMSHEIRTPLNAVLGYSQLLMTDTHLTPQQHERMNAILNAGQRLLHLINDILDLSKIEAGALHFRQDYFDLHQELNDIIALMRTKAIAKGLVLNYDIQLPSPAIIKSDRQKIGQIILNLLGNAIKFTNKGEINLNVHINNNSILFNVIDTGPGIAAQELQVLFAAFKQGKSGEESGGTGLGLVISKHIAESLGGELTLDSEPGKGTRAHLRLPISIEYNAQLDTPTHVVQAKLAEHSHCKVLVVEDDSASRDVLVNLLRDMGCDVAEAFNGEEGLTQALTQKFDIVFTDIRMPELSGTDMLKQLRKTIAKESLPVIAVSASSLEHERTFYLGEGFHEFIGKPYQFRDIYSALQKFTAVEFASVDNNLDGSIGEDAERVGWHNPQELIALQQQLGVLKSAFNNGDMNTSKKLFAAHSAQTIGKNSFQKIHTAIRQYDLVLAEEILDALMAEITEALKQI